MKRITIWFMFLFILTGSVFSQKFTQEEFMKKYLEKTGLGKYNEIKTIVIEGDNQIVNDHYPFRLYFKAPNHYRMKERYQNDLTYKIISGNFRKVNGSEGRQMDMSQIEIDMIVNTVNFMEGFLANYKQNGFKIQYLGLDTLNKTTVFRQTKGVSSPLPPEPMITRADTFDITKLKIDTLLTAIVYKIKVTTPQEKDYVMKLDTNTMNILWSSGNPFVIADIAPIKFNIYEKIDKFSFPTHIVTESNFIPSTLRISSIKLNEEIPDAYFDPNSKENQVVKEN